MISLHQIIREQLSISSGEAMRLDIINQRASILSQRVYDFTIYQSSKLGIELSDKKKLKYDIDSAINDEVIIEIDEDFLKKCH